MHLHPVLGAPPRCELEISPQKVNKIKIPKGQSGALQLCPTPSPLPTAPRRHQPLSRNISKPPNFKDISCKEDSPAASLPVLRCKHEVLLVLSTKNGNFTFQLHALGQRNGYYLPHHLSTAQIRAIWAQRHSHASPDSCRQPSKTSDTETYIKASSKRYLKCLLAASGFALPKYQILEQFPLLERGNSCLVCAGTQKHSKLNYNTDKSCICNPWFSTFFIIYSHFHKCKNEG